MASADRRSFRLAELTWTEVQGRVSAGAALAVPIGSTEQHGPHLPLATDTTIAAALCDAAASSGAVELLVAPPVAIGASGEHDGFAGTLSIGLEALELMLVELGRSATESFGRVIFVNAHGGNYVAGTRAVSTLRSEGRDVVWFSPRWEGDAHAGHVETSVHLALDPAQVRIDAMEPGDGRPLEDVFADLVAGGLAAVTANGILGDPTSASALAGRQFLRQAVEELVALISVEPRRDEKEHA